MIHAPDLTPDEGHPDTKLPYPDVSYLDAHLILLLRKTFCELLTDEKAGGDDLTWNKFKASCQNAIFCLSLELVLHAISESGALDMDKATKHLSTIIYKD